MLCITRGTLFLLIRSLTIIICGNCGGTIHVTISPAWNPELWLVPPQGWGALAGRVTNNHSVPVYGQIVDAVSQENGQVWKARTYGKGNVRSDDYYRENVVISDLPAGRYDIYIHYLGRNYVMEIQINPGQVSYFTFRGRNGFSLTTPRLPGADFTPPPPWFHPNEEYPLQFTFTLDIQNICAKLMTSNYFKPE